MTPSRGIIVVAQNTETVDYVEQACLLAMSLHATTPGTKISINTNDDIPTEYVTLFDNIIPIMWNDDAAQSDWKIENRWKVFHASPYDETIVMDTDILVLQDINFLWDFYSNYDLFFTSNVYTYRKELIASDYYRKTFTANDLPNLYSGLYYFKKTDFSLEFFEYLRLVTHNWELFYGKFVTKEYPAHPSFDVSCAIVAKIMGCVEDITNPTIGYPLFVHMKSKVQNWRNAASRWQDVLGVYVSDNCSIKLGNHLQTGILHYTEKDFVTPEIMDKYRKLVNV